MRYKIMRAFSCCLNFEKDQIRELTDAERDKYAHMIEPIDNGSVNSTDGKPNKQYKKGRIKG